MTFKKVFGKIRKDNIKCTLNVYSSLTFFPLNECKKMRVKYLNSKCILLYKVLKGTI